MEAKKFLEIHQILEKLELHEEEAEIFVSYFFKKYLSEKCNLSLHLNAESYYERENVYMNISGEIDLKDNDDTILSSSDYASANLN